jgi:hypothetical protein
LVYEGLLEVLDPSRRALRVQREQLAVTKASVPVKVERRACTRRRGRERRVTQAAAPNGIDRRSGTDRRMASDRRKRQ